MSFSIIFVGGVGGLCWMYRRAEIMRAIVVVAVAMMEAVLWV